MCINRTWKFITFKIKNIRNHFNPNLDYTIIPWFSTCSKRSLLLQNLLPQVHHQKKFSNISFFDIVLIFNFLIFSIPSSRSVVEGLSSTLWFSPLLRLLQFSNSAFFSSTFSTSQEKIRPAVCSREAVSYTHLTLPTRSYV